MAPTPKLKASPAITTVFAKLHTATKVGMQKLAKNPMVGKIAALKDHALVQKVMAKEELLWSILGVVLILHGTHFKKLFLSIQFFRAFCYERLYTSVKGLCNDVQEAYAKTCADAGDDQPAEKDDEVNKHAKKRENKKAAEAASKDTTKEDAAMMKKMMKALDSEKLSAACIEIFLSILACFLVLQGGLVQNILVSHMLVTMLAKEIIALVDLSEHDDVATWTNLCIRFILYVVFMSLAKVAAPFTLAMSVAACGTKLLMAHIPKLEKLEDQQALVVPFAIAAFGTLWQVWTLMAGSEMAWYFQIIYFPAVFAECILGLF